MHEAKSAGIAADVPPTACDDMRLYSQATFSVKNRRDILNDDALHFKLARCVLKIASFEFVNSTSINFTCKNARSARLALNTKCEMQQSCSRQ